MCRHIHRVRMTETAKRMLRDVKKRYGKNTYETLRDLIQGLAIDPGQKGDALHKPLAGLHSLHYSRFRVVYRIDQGELVVLVVGVGFHASGERRDIYQIVERLVETGHIRV